MRRSGVSLCAFLLLVVPASGDGDEASYTLQNYANHCAATIAEVPAFNCLDLEIIPITVNGEIPETYTPNMTCDRPAMLPYPSGTHGNCTPYSRVKVNRDDDIQMIQLCRRMFIRPADDPNFDSIEVIMHNVKTGSTCFFISKNFGSKPEGDNGLRVPPPSEVEPPDGNVSAEALWATPQETVGHGCIYCHDSDPWMRTPWIAQTGELPANPWGFHTVDAGGPFDDWPKPESISTRGNTCTGCHRIGSLNTCKQLDIPLFGEQPSKMLQSIGQAPNGRFAARPGTVHESPPEFYDEQAATYPNSAWMPPGNTLPYAEWRRIYEDDVKQLQRCCENPDAAGCHVSPIQGLRDYLESLHAVSAPAVPD